MDDTPCEQSGELLVEAAAARGAALVVHHGVLALRGRLSPEQEQ